MVECGRNLMVSHLHFDQSLRRLLGRRVWRWLWPRRRILGENFGLYCQHEWHRLKDDYAAYARARLTRQMWACVGTVGLILGCAVTIAVVVALSLRSARAQVVTWLAGYQFR